MACETLYFFLKQATCVHTRFVHNSRLINSVWIFVSTVGLQKRPNVSQDFCLSLTEPVE